MTAHISAAGARSWPAKINNNGEAGTLLSTQSVAFCGDRNKKTANMVLLWRPEGSEKAGTSFITFTGEEDADVNKFFFVFENVFTKDKTSWERADVILRHLEGPAFEFYYETFSEDGTLLPGAEDYIAVKQAILRKFSRKANPEENIRKAVSATIESADILGSMKIMDSLYGNAGFNEEAKYGLLRNSAVKHPDLAQFVIYRAPSAYAELKKTLKDFVSGRNAFLAATGSEGSPESKGSFVAPMKILTRPDARAGTEQQLEAKVDALANQMAELSLIVKKSQTQEGRNTTRQCSYCQKSGHGAGRCESNPHRNTRSPRCQKWSHFEATCRIKIKPEQTRKVTIAEARTEFGVEQKLASSGHPVGNSAGNQVSIVTEVCSDDFVAATKRTADGEPLPK